MCQINQSVWCFRLAEYVNHIRSEHPFQRFYQLFLQYEPDKSQLFAFETPHKKHN